MSCCFKKSNSFQNTSDQNIYKQYIMYHLLYITPNVALKAEDSTINYTSVLREKNLAVTSECFHSL